MSSPYRWLFVAILLSIPASSAPAQHVHSAEGSEVLSLVDLLAEVRTSNTSLRAARLEAEALATRPRQVGSLPDPSVSVGYRPFAVGGLDGVAPAQATVQQTIPFPGKLSLAAEVASHEAEMAERQADEHLLDLEYQIKEAYYELFMLQQHTHHLHDFQKQLDDFEEAAAIRYEVGVGPQQAILKAQLERNTLSRRLLDLSSERRRHVEHLARLVNRPDLAADVGHLVFERAPLEAPPAVGQALQTRPELKAVDAGLNAAEAEIALAKKEYLPDFTVGAGIMDMMGTRAEVMPLENAVRRFGIEIGIVLPIRKGRRDAALEEARIRRDVLQARREAIRTEIVTELNDLQNRLVEDEKALALYSGTLMPQAESTLEATLSAYTTGRADFLDLLDARRMLLDLDMEYEHTYADYLKTRALLERTAGVISSPPVATR